MTTQHSIASILLLTAACIDAPGSEHDPHDVSTDDARAAVLAPPCLGKYEMDDWFGLAVAIGDFDDDGFDDVAVGSPGEDLDLEREVGMVHVFKGSATGLAPWFGLTQTGLGVDQRTDRFGAALAAGDFDGDGKDDLAVGAPGQSVDGEDNAGWVFTFRGGATGLVPWTSFGQTDVDTAGDLFGAAMVAGDLDGDGKDDLAVGTPGEDALGQTDVGFVSIHRGGPAGLSAWYGLHHNAISPVQAGEHFGAALTIGDWNGDGRAELAVGVPDADAGMGAVYVFVTAAAAPYQMSATQRLDQIPLSQNELGDHFGAALAAGDFDGDGDDDLAVGAPDEQANGAAHSGQTFVFQASTAGLIAWLGFTSIQVLGPPALANGRFGRTMIAGDLNDDGKDDLVVGRDHHQTIPAGAFAERAGQLYLFRGTPSGPIAWGVRDQTGLGGNEAGDDFGKALAIGDLDGDGRPDLVAGAPGEAPGGPDDAGYAFAFRGQPGTTLPTAWTGISQQKNGCTPSWPTPPHIEVLSKTAHSIRLRFAGPADTTILSTSFDDDTSGTLYVGTFHAATHVRDYTGLVPSHSYCATARRLVSTSRDHSDTVELCVTTNPAGGG